MAMNLTPENSYFVKYVPSNEENSYAMQHTQEISEADGFVFNCPRGCGHRIHVWFSSVNGVKTDIPLILKPSARYIASGDSVKSLTLFPSIDLNTRDNKECRWHGWIQNGEAI